MRKGFNGRIKLQKADFRESSVELHNPGCGWYHVYYFSIQESAGPEKWEDTEKSLFLYEEEELVLALINIGFFQTMEITPEGLGQIEHILRFFQKNGKEIILRFAYDMTGHGLEREPASMALVKRHMEQLKVLVMKYADTILVIQGILVGNWGEMHGSKFLTERYLTELAEAWYSAIEGSCYLAVRTPAQWRTIIGDGKKSLIPPKKLALFNDGIFGSPTDLGTYGVLGRQEAGEKESWSREDELAWQDAYLDMVPNGGEVLAGDTLVSYRQAVEELKKMHVSYLNSAYQQEQLDYWRDERVKRQGCWENLSGYEYIGRHLGYRFVVRDVKTLSGCRLQIEVENCGFASLCEAAECFLIIEEDNGQTSRIPLDIDACKWKCGEKIVLQVAIPHPEQIEGRGELFLEVKRKKDGRSLRFANQGADERVLLGRF